MATQSTDQRFTVHLQGVDGEDAIGYVGTYEWDLDRALLLVAGRQLNGYNSGRMVETEYPVGRVLNVTKLRD